VLPDTPDRQNNANQNKLFSGAETSHTGARVTSLTAPAQNVLHVNDGRVSVSLTQVVFVRASLILLRLAHGTSGRRPES
jgi:hypothetical protein